MHQRSVVAVVTLVAAIVVGASTATPSPSLRGAWRKLPPAPFAVPQDLTGAWTGKELIVFGRRPLTSPAADAAEAYDPYRGAWTRLSPPAGPGFVPSYDAVWTGKELLAFGAFHSVAFNPARRRWRALPRPLPGGIVVWTGREAIGWGGGCCGDASASGAAFDPAAGTYRTLPRSPLAPSQRPVGAWTGRELVLLVGGFDPEGKPWPARLARAAAYNPATNAWRRIAPLPENGLGVLGAAAWDGRELPDPVGPRDRAHRLSSAGAARTERSPLR